MKIILPFLLTNATRIDIYMYGELVQSPNEARDSALLHYHSLEERGTLWKALLGPALVLVLASVCLSCSPPSSLPVWHPQRS